MQGICSIKTTGKTNTLFSCSTGVRQNSTKLLSWKVTQLNLWKLHHEKNKTKLAPMTFSHLNAINCATHPSHF